MNVSKTHTTAKKRPKVLCTASVLHGTVGWQWFTNTPGYHFDVDRVFNANKFEILVMPLAHDTKTTVEERCWINAWLVLLVLFPSGFEEKDRNLNTVNPILQLAAKSELFTTCKIQTVQIQEARKTEFILCTDCIEVSTGG